MCYWIGSKKVREELIKIANQNPEDEIAQLYYKTFNTTENNQPIIEPKEYYVAIGKSNPELTVLTRENQELRFKNIKWGLHWSYTNKQGESYSRVLLNSTCEKVFWQHRDIIYKNRCIIPMDGYFEFYHKNGETYPHFLYPESGLFYAGGMWSSEVDKNTGEISETLSIITTPPNDITKKLHNNPKAPNGPRMLLLINKDEIMDFLDTQLNQSQLKKFFKPFDKTQIKFHPVIRFLKRENIHLINSPQVQKECQYPELVA